MKTIFLHGLGQTAQDWEEVIRQTALSEVDCPELFSLSEGEITYFGIRNGLEKRYADITEPFCICGLSLGALLALDYAIRHNEQVAALVLIGVQYKVPSLLIDFRILFFAVCPIKLLMIWVCPKNDVIRLAHSMRSLDFRSGLKDIKCPVTISAEKKDRANLKASRQLAELLSQSKLRIVPGAAHELNKCAPEAIADVWKK